MTITKYRASNNCACIEAVVVEKETAQSVWVKGWTLDGGAGSAPLSKRAKRSSYDNYFDTWDEAKAFLLLDAEASLANARLQLHHAQGHLGNVKGMKPPKEAA